VYGVQVQLWKHYILWEKNNPLRSEDTTLITKRGEVTILLGFLWLVTSLCSALTDGARADRVQAGRPSLQMPDGCVVPR